MALVGIYKQPFYKLQGSKICSRCVTLYSIQESVFELIPTSGFIWMRSLHWCSKTTCSLIQENHSSYISIFCIICDQDILSVDLAELLDSLQLTEDLLSVNVLNLYAQTRVAASPVWCSIIWSLKWLGFNQNKLLSKLTYTANIRWSMTYAFPAWHH